MNYELQLQKLEDTRRKTLEVVATLDSKLKNEEIDGLQYQILLHEKLLGKTKEEILSYLDGEKKKIFDKIDREKEEQVKYNSTNRGKTATIAITAILLIACIGLLFLNENGISGFIIKEFNTQDSSSIITNQTIEQTLNYTNIIGLKISGTIDKGSALVKLRLADNSELIVGNLIATNTGNTYTLTTDKKVYALGEIVNITLTPNNDATSTYIYHNEEQTILNNNTYSPQTIGEYKIVTIITEGEYSERLELNFTVADESTNDVQTVKTATVGAINTFTDKCDETCNINETSNPVLIIEPIDGATVVIDKITTTTQKENNAPVQIKVLEDLEINDGEEKQIDLSQYFTDVDNETIFFDITGTENVTTSINGNILTITGTNVGTDFANIYATDGTEITTSNEFTITINPAVQITENNTINETTNNTINETLENSTIEINNILNLTNSTFEINLNNTNLTINNETNNTISEIVDCNLPVNERPNVCFEGNESKYFKDIIATLENKNGETVGRFNRFGNFIIKGLLVEDSSTANKERDFTIIYKQVNDLEETITTTAWIDSTTGNLYLKGKVYEENTDLTPPQFNTYIIKNKAGIVLAYFDETTGDLYLRGNLVQLGKVVQ